MTKYDREQEPSRWEVLAASQAREEYARQLENIARGYHPKRHFLARFIQWLFQGH